MNMWVHVGTRRIYCSDDHANYAKNHTAAATERRRVYNESWRRANRDKMAAYQRNWYKRKTGERDQHDG